ncbi:RNA polymerase, sigma subunit, ECF family [Pedobacter westerhofensis]|uniref:RNA polymerase, sigma subunit, ECF family n=1 Tax=Pedobacter westerhofensis TaxID=425512 RepID=A0A521FLI1_9SPHI|nr:sigma-70 family RNA polymerase sigma factor [Pedobacter westerhofensis]SMO96999.1 RNA polymerase, sigma subunit, ECF family [Pedobacter westerhofensis]
MASNIYTHPQEYNTDESLLLKGLKENSEPAFRNLYYNYKSALLAIILKMMKNKEEAEDILQETFINISKNLHLYDPDKGRLFTWMARVARNKTLDNLKSPSARHSIHQLDVEELDEDILRPLQISCFNVEAIGLKTLTDGLNASQRKVIDFIYFNGYTHLEVAEALNVPLGTVKTRNRMAMNTLRAFF